MLYYAVLVGSDRDTSNTMQVLKPTDTAGSWKTGLERTTRCVFISTRERRALLVCIKTL